jgi:hypothetical protein
VISKSHFCEVWRNQGGNGVKKGEAVEWSRETVIHGEEFGVTGLCI